MPTTNKIDRELEIYQKGSYHAAEEASKVGEGKSQYFIVENLVHTWFLRESLCLLNRKEIHLDYAQDIYN